MRYIDIKNSYKLNSTINISFYWLPELFFARTIIDSGFNLFTGAIGVPVVLLVLEGGPNTVRTMCELIKKKIPAVVVDGSGRAADVVAYAYSHTIKKWWAFIAVFVNPRVNKVNIHIIFFPQFSLKWLCCRSNSPRHKRGRDRSRNTSRNCVWDR